MTLALSDYLPAMLGRLVAHQKREEEKAAEHAEMQERVWRQNAEYVSGLKLHDPREN